MDDKIPAHPPASPAPIAVSSRQDQRHRRSAGAALIGIGLLVFIRQVARSDMLDLLFLPALGLIFLLWGSATRQVGLLLPGGVLGGVGLGVLVADRLRGHVGDEAAGGLFLLCFALGWAGITLLSAFFTARTAWWPLIAGGVIAALGGLALLGGSGRGVLAAIGGPVVPVLALVRDLWPLGLIAVGLSLILRRGRARE